VRVRCVKAQSDMSDATISGISDLAARLEALKERL
jgi:hypothetical protein